MGKFIDRIDGLVRNFAFCISAFGSMFSVWPPDLPNKVGCPNVIFSPDKTSFYILSGVSGGRRGS